MFTHEPSKSELFEREKFIFVYQDVRGRFMSEGDFVTIRPHKPVKNGPKDIDESSDTYDTVAWLIKNVPGIDAYTSDYVKQALAGITDDTKGASFQKGTVQVTPGGN